MKNSDYLMENLTLLKITQFCSELKKESLLYKNDINLLNNLQLLSHKKFALAFNYKKGMAYCTETQDLVDIRRNKYKKSNTETTIEIVYNFKPDSIYIQASEVNIYIIKNTPIDIINSLVEKTKNQVLNRYNNQTDFININNIFSALNKIKALIDISNNEMNYIKMEI